MRMTTHTQARRAGEGEESVVQIMFVYIVKMCHYDWYNKELNGQLLHRISRHGGCLKEEGWRYKKTGRKQENKM